MTLTCRGMKYNFKYQTRLTISLVCFAQSRFEDLKNMIELCCKLLNEALDLTGVRYLWIATLHPQALEIASHPLIGA